MKTDRSHLQRDLRDIGRWIDRSPLARDPVRMLEALRAIDVDVQPLPNGEFRIAVRVDDGLDRRACAAAARRWLSDQRNAARARAAMQFEAAAPANRLAA